jgi:aspartate aminotransferase-like enzyme
MGGTEINVDKWGLDVCFSSSQKCFGVPPGLSVGSVSPHAIKKSQLVQNKGWYFDFKVWEKYQQRNGTPMTSVISQIAGLSRILEIIESNGGKHWFFDIYLKRNRMISEGVKKLGLTLFPKVGYESPTVNCINAPEGVDGTTIYEGMRREGYEIAKGYGSIRNLTFRIGNMGYIKFEDIKSMLDSLENILPISI